MRIEHPSAGIGVTLLSDYPNSDSYLRLRRWDGQPSFMLSPHHQSSAGATCVGRTDTGVEPSPNVWYHFRFRTVDENGATRVLARVWADGETEPDDWPVDCLWSAWAEAAGRPGVWSMGPGRKSWDDLGARTISSASEPGEDPGSGDAGGPASGALLYAESFESMAVGRDPAGWVDTAYRNSMDVRDELFEVGEAPGGGRALMTRFRRANMHSHLLDGGAAAWQDYEYSGRMFVEDKRTGIGVTLYSEYPERDRYIRLRRYDGRPGFHLANHPDSSARCVGETESGVISRPGAWYAFRLRAFDEGGSTRVLGKVWADTDAEPSDWQIDCVATDALPGLRQGAPGVWSMGGGYKYWDDLTIEALSGAAP